MNPDAVRQAKSRLQRAERALSDFDNAQSIDEAEAAWTDFLIAASTIYSKLEQGAKGFPKSQTWFGKKKHERKKDPLLRYLHFARNCNEHGIIRVAATTGDNRGIDGLPLHFNERRNIQFQMISKDNVTPEGPILDGVIAGPTLKPVRAVDERFNDFCDPPTTHLGDHINFHNFVDGLGKAAIPYFKEMLEEAQGLSNH